MKYASDFRRIARGALKGKWGIAVIVGLIASLLGAASGGFEVNLDISEQGVVANLEFAEQTIYSVGSNSHGMNAIIVGGAMYAVLAALVMWAVYLFLGSVVKLGYARFHLNLVDCSEASVGQLFGYFSYWKNAVVANLLRSIYTLLWTLLLIIPGIMANYSYSMTDYILAESPDMTAQEAITRSKEMMQGNRWRLFCLQISFIGWHILSGLTFGIGELWLRPYTETAKAAFYREISDTWRNAGNTFRNEETAEWETV